MTQTTSKRILITGLSTYWGARLARELEQNPDVEAIIGVDSADPAGELERTEFVRVGTQHALLRRGGEGGGDDTPVDTPLVVRPTPPSAPGPPQKKSHRGEENPPPLRRARNQ